MRFVLLALICSSQLGLGCGDNTVARQGFEDLVADPAVLSGCLTDPVVTTRAKHVECLGEVPSGLLASGRAGDIVIENSQIEVVLRASGEGFIFPGTGAGGIIDVAHLDGDDGVKELAPLAELNSVHATQVVITEAGDDGPATVVVRGHVEPIPLLVKAAGIARTPVTIETTYSLEQDSLVLRISSRLLGDDGVDSSFQLGDVFFFSGRITPWLPGVGPTSDVESAEFVASGGPEISYGFVYPASQTSVQFVSVTGVTAVLGPGVSASESAPSPSFDRFLVVGDGSVSSVTDAAWELRGQPLGVVEGSSAPGVEVVVRDVADRLITVARTDSTGAFSLSLPPGSYSMTADSPERDPADATSVDVVASQSVTVDVAASEKGMLQVSVTEEGAGPVPARVVVRRGEERRIHFADAGGLATVGLPVGTWIVEVSRGVEYDAFTQTAVEITSGQETSVDATLNRVIDTTGWISLDSHLHSEMSVDSTVPLDDRVRSVAAEGVEIAISSDHDFITSYSPSIEALGLQEFVNHQNGMETSPFTLGHFNSWPQVRDEARAAGGAIAWYDLPPGGIFAAMRQRNPDSVVQVNHPRNGLAGFFDAIDFNRELAMATQDPRGLGFPGADLNDFNFDAIEVGNDFNPDQFASSLADFLALVAAGHTVVATGSSDSHGLRVFAGKSRTYIFVGEGNDAPATVDLDAVNTALKAGRVVVSQGAFITAQLLDSESALVPFGEVAELGDATTARLQITVQAPPWMQLENLVIYQGREIATTLVLDNTATTPIRFSGVLDLPIAGDGFFLVLATPAGPGAPVLEQPDASFTNPILYRAD